MRLKYVTNYSNDELVTKSSTVPDCLRDGERGQTPSANSAAREKHSTVYFCQHMLDRYQCRHGNIIITAQKPDLVIVSRKDKVVTIF